MSQIPDVSWSRVAGFVRQHTHDLRNELNGLDLEAALLSDIVTDPEACESVARMRAEIYRIAASLRTLSARFSASRASRVVIAADELFRAWREQARDLPGFEVVWQNRLGDGRVNVDPAAVAQALRELLANAHAFKNGGNPTATAYVDGNVFFELLEPKIDAVDPARWGRSPFASTRHGGYGLGLCTVLETIEANGGTVSWTFDPALAALVTLVSFPPAEGV